MIIYHVWTRFLSTDLNTQRRMDLARASWKIQPWMEVPVDDCDLKRHWEEKGRSLPYVRDLFDFGYQASVMDDDIIVMTNADIVVAQCSAVEIQEKLKDVSACYAFRRDFPRLHRIPTDAEFAKGEDYSGSDLYAFRRSWWRDNREKMPDMILGLEAWDPCFRILCQETNPGKTVSIPNIIAHEKHGGANHWADQSNRYRTEGQHYCLKLACEFFFEHDHEPTQYGIPEWYIQERGLVRKKKLAEPNVCIVQMGHYGDIINLLPIAHHLHKQGKKVWWLVPKPYRNIFDAVSYVTPLEIEVPKNYRQMIEAANVRFEKVILGGLWDFGMQGNPICQAYNLDHWRVAGYLEHFFDPEFVGPLDKWRDASMSTPSARVFVEYLEKTHGWTGDMLRPIVCNVTHGDSSPYSYGQTLLKKLKAAFPDMVLDIGPLRLPHFLNLLPIIRSARVLVSIDTGTLWLSEYAPHTPVVSIVSNLQWGGSVLRRPVNARVTYREAQYEPRTVIGPIERILGVKAVDGWQSVGEEIKEGKWPEVFKRGAINGESDMRLRYDAIKAWRQVLEGVRPCMHFDSTMRAIATRLGVETSDLIEFRGQRKVDKVPKLP